VRPQLCDFASDDTYRILYISSIEAQLSRQHNESPSAQNVCSDAVCQTVLLPQDLMQPALKQQSRCIYDVKWDRSLHAEIDHETEDALGVLAIYQRTSEAIANRQAGISGIWAAER
jgi:hypothetical protein